MANSTLTEQSRPPPPGTGHIASSCLRQDAQRTRRDLSGFLAHPNDEKAPADPQMDALQADWPVLPHSVAATETQGRPRGCP